MIISICFLGKDGDLRGADLVGSDFSGAVHGSYGRVAACETQCALCAADGDCAAVSVRKGHFVLCRDDLGKSLLLFKMNGIASVRTGAVSPCPDIISFSGSKGLSQFEIRPFSIVIIVKEPFIGIIEYFYVRIYCVVRRIYSIFGCYSRYKFKHHIR